MALLAFLRAVQSSPSRTPSLQHVPQEVEDRSRVISIASPARGCPGGTTNEQAAHDATASTQVARWSVLRQGRSRLRSTLFPTAPGTGAALSRCDTRAV